MTDKPLTVEQVDREAAADYLDDQGGHDIDAHVIRLGDGDHKNLVQAFARHRLSALATRPTEAREGMVLVPKEPTEAMIDRFVSRALCVSIDSTNGGWSQYARDQWSAMLTAAPQPTTEARERIVRVHLVERKLDDDCACPEEIYDTAWGYLHMHLSAGKLSNAVLDNGDEGEREITLTAASIGAARSAIFGWAALYDPICATPQPVREKHRREVQSVWRCAFGDVAGALDILKNQWLGSRRKHEREAGAVLASVADLVWANRDPAPGSYEEAAASGKGLHVRVATAIRGRE